MLVLTRKPLEAVTIYTSDGPITIMIRRVNGERVGLVFDAPDHVEIIRSEHDDLMPT